MRWWLLWTALFWLVMTLWAWVEPNTATLLGFGSLILPIWLVEEAGLAFWLVALAPCGLLVYLGRRKSAVFWTKTLVVVLVNAVMWFAAAYAALYFMHRVHEVRLFA